MSKDRLLRSHEGFMDTIRISKDKIIDGQLVKHEELQKIISVALAARDKEWVEWAIERCPHKSDFRIQRECDTCWQERKKEIDCE